MRYLPVLTSLTALTIAVLLAVYFAGFHHSAVGNESTRKGAGASNGAEGSGNADEKGITPAEIADDNTETDGIDTSKYDAWVAQTLDDSRKGKNTAIVVDKTAYRLFLVKSGDVTANYPVELGFNPVDDKRMEGDGSTPEGYYKVVEKRDVGKTRFYRGFLLNYPNNLDKKEFAEEKKKGLIPSDAAIGGMILIHGHGSGMPGNAGGANWTLGCVALSNSDIDKLFPHVSVGMRVTIVKACSVLDAGDID